MADHVLDASTTVHRWNPAYPPRLTIASGDVVTVETRDASGGQVRPGMDAEAFSRIDTGLIHALTGPIAIDGAEPGDVLVVEVIDLQHHGWAWTSIIPGLGLLDSDFDRPFIHHWELDGDVTRSMPGVTLDLHPFCGVMGVQPAEPGEIRTRPPGPFGGNMDVRHLGKGAVLRLPVFQPGAGFCAGDCHAAQGDGEVSINGMEAPMTVVLRFRVEKQLALAAPHARVPGDLLPRRYRSAPWQAFIESHREPRLACREVVRRAIDYLVNRLGITAEQAYVLCSVVLDLKISQLVNVPMTTVTGYVPEAVFDL